MPAPPPPRIGFNAALLSPSASDHRAAGIHRYIAALLPALARSGQVRLVAFAAPDAARAALPPSVEVHGLPPLAGSRLGRIVWEQVALPGSLARSGANAYHGAAYAMPAASRLPAVVTVHDLSFFRMPETLPRAQAFYLRAATRLSARRASALIAVSAFTAAELQDVLAVPAERIHVVPNGLDESFRRPDEGAVAAYRERRGLPAGFVLAVGTLQPRKNLAVLLAAVAELAQRGPMRPPDLVVAGAPGWGDIDIAAEARRLGLEGTVRVTGYVEPSELPLLYASAAVFAFPSRYEGFGLPAVEAMACGTPVIAARASSLPEVCGDAAVLVDPGVPAAWADALGRLLSSPGERQRLAAAGIARAAGFSWDKAAAGTLEAYRHALDGARVPLASGPCRSAGAARRASQACPEDQDG